MRFLKEMFITILHLANFYNDAIKTDIMRNVASTISLLNYQVEGVYIPIDIYSNRICGSN